MRCFEAASTVRYEPLNSCITVHSVWIMIFNVMLLNTCSRNKRRKNCEESRWRSQSTLVRPLAMSCLNRCRDLIGSGLKPHLHALKNQHGTPNFWHRADDFKVRPSQFSTCKRIGPKSNVAPVLKILGVPRLPPGGSLGTGKRGTVPKIWRAGLIF